MRIILYIPRKSKKKIPYTVSFLDDFLSNLIKAIC